MDRADLDGHVRVRFADVVVFNVIIREAHHGGLADRCDDVHLHPVRNEVLADDIDIVILVVAGVLPAAGPDPVEDEIIPVLELLVADAVIDFPHPQAVVCQEVLQDLKDLIPQALAPPPDTSRPAPRPCPCRW